MIEFLIMAGMGVLVSVLGIINMTGNISSLHSYHRARVSEKDKKPFGKLVGLGTLIIGVSIIIFGALLYAFEETGLEILSIIGVTQMIVCLVVGLTISFYAMKKYNGGIF